MRAHPSRVPPRSADPSRPSPGSRTRRALVARLVVRASAARPPSLAAPLLALAFVAVPIGGFPGGTVAAAEPDAETARVLALSDDVGWGEYLAGECVTCHAAEAASGAKAPRIHGLDAARLARALLDYRAGARDNTTMVNVATALADEEIAALAHYLSGAGTADTR